MPCEAATYEALLVQAEQAERLLERGRLEQAMALAEEVLDAAEREQAWNPIVEAHAVWARCLTQRGLAEEARRLGQRLLDTAAAFPQDAGEDASWQAGRVRCAEHLLARAWRDEARQLRARDPERAEAACRESLALSEDVEVRLERVELLVALGRREDALACLEEGQALDAQHGHPRHARRLARALGELRGEDRDRPLASRHPADPLRALMACVGEARQADESGDREGALEACQRAAALAAEVDLDARAFVLGVAVEIAARLGGELEELSRATPPPG